MKSSLLLIGLLIPLSTLSISCFGRGMVVVSNDPGPVVVYDYWYYPAWGVYYDYDTHYYFYPEGSSWVRVRHLPKHYHGLGAHVVVESERGRPWARYEEHRVKYPPPARKEIKVEERGRGPGIGREKLRLNGNLP